MSLNLTINFISSLSWNGWLVAHNLNDSIRSTHNGRQIAHHITNDHEVESEKLEVEEEGRDITDRSAALLHKDARVVDNCGHGTVKEHLVHERIQALIARLAATLPVDLNVSILKFSQLSLFIAKSLDGANVRERLFSHGIHFTLGFLNAGLKTAHPALIEPHH